MSTNGTITIFRPGKRFPSVSVTGGRCDLMCAHCRGEHLKGMHCAENADALIEKALSVHESGGTGMLISGGCDANGKVPLITFRDAIERISKMGMRINAHAGFLTEREASDLVNAGVGRFSVDVHQDPNVIRNVLNLNSGPEEYERTIGNIIAAGGVPVPHLTAGFGENDIALSMEMLKRTGVTDIVLLALVGTRGTETKNVSEECILDTIHALIENGFRVTLGCMRPRNPETEMKAVMTGVRRIANPSARTVKWLKENGFDVVSEDMCCCMPVSERS